MAASLSEEQAIALRKVLSFVEKRSSGVFGLKGRAGTGKTHLVLALMAELQKRGCVKLAYLAPNNALANDMRAKMRVLTIPTTLAPSTAFWDWVCSFWLGA